MKINKYDDIWNKKPSLRMIYESFYSRIKKHCIDGNILEIGGGIGNFNIKGSDIVRIDIQPFASVSVVADAQCLPFSNNSFDNIVMIDVLHHIECPVIFFKEANRVLRPNGRLVMIEPGITTLSWILYKLMHNEPVNMGWNPLVECTPNPEKDPYDSNQAIPTLLFGRHIKIFEEKTDFILIKKQWLSLFAYPLSGGFQKWSLISHNWVKRILNMEEKILPILGSIMAFRLLIVLTNKK
jgi:SAM-dependent methyltransferase